jgi:hypothetical protein
MTSGREPPARSPGMLPVPVERAMARRVGFRRCRRHQRPVPGRTPDPNRGRRGLRQRAFQGRRGLRPPRRTSGDRGPARLVPQRPGPPGSARRVRALRGPRAPRERGPGRRARRDPALPGRVPPGRAAPARPARAPRVPARGPVTTRSVRPRPAWVRRPRPGPRVPFPASLVVRVRRRAARAVPGVPAAHAQGRAGQVGPGPRMHRAPAGRDLAARGQAR